MAAVSAPRSGVARAHALRRAVEMDRLPDQVEASQRRVIDRGRDAEVDHLRILHRLVDAVDRTAGDAARVELDDPLRARAPLGQLADRRVERLAVARPQSGVGVLRLLRELGLPQRFEQRAELRAARRRDVDVAVGGGEDAHRRQRRVVVAGLLGHLALDQEARRLEVEHADQGFEQRRGHPLALAAARALVERHQDAAGEVEAGGEVGDGDADAHRSLTGKAGHRHQAAETLRDLIDAGAIAVRPVLSESRDAAVDDPRVDRAHRVVVDAEAVLDVGAEVLDHDVGTPRQREEDLAAARVLQVERDAALVAVQVLEVGAVAAAAGDVVVGAGRLDADHLGAPVGELAHRGRDRRARS